MTDRFTYRKAGVDIEAGSNAVNRIKALAQSTFGSEVLQGIGGFGALFNFPKDRYEDPVLVSATDGVGTKLKIAQQLEIHDTVGIDLVAMCVNDVVTSGATPLFFLDYIAIGKVVPEKVEQLVKGMAEGCKQAECALIGGEIAEHPGVMPEDEYDLAGFAVGAVEKDEIVDGATIKSGDSIVALPSSGLHSNGFSLVRKILDEKELDPGGSYGLKTTLGEELLKPTDIYWKSVKTLKDRINIKGIAHITGGGIKGNLIRILPRGLGAEISLSSWERPKIYSIIQEFGAISDAEMLSTFNLGVGMALIVGLDGVDAAREILMGVGMACSVIGTVISTPGLNFIE